MLRAIILIAALVIVRGDECVPRSFGKDLMVCVCNSTYCDTTTVVPDLQEDQVLWYTSTRDGKRMDLSVNNFLAPNENENDMVLTVDSSKKYQTILGFGGAMTDSAALNIRTLSNETQRTLIESYFGPKGIGYTFVRIPIAGTDFSTRPYTYDDVPGDVTLSNFSLVEEDNYKIEYLHDIKNAMPDPDSLRIFTTAWSAPAWMKNTDNIKWGEEIRGTLQRKYYGLYAEYIKRFFDAYKERGIDIWGMTPGNEPINGFFPFFSFNAMAWTPENVALWSTNYLAPTLSKAGYDPVYMALDDQRFEIPWYVDIMFKSNRKAANLFSGTAFHWYFDDIISPNTLSNLHEHYPDKFILMTEACTGSFKKVHVILGSWERGQQYALDIIENLSHWVVGWIDWNIALNDHGAPNWAQNYVDSPIIVMPQNDEFYKQPMFYALSHFSQFVPRNSSRILSTGLENNTNIKTIAFLTPRQQIVVVAVNKADFSAAITIKDEKTNNKINVDLPANSFNTILYSTQEEV